MKIRYYSKEDFKRLGIYSILGGKTLCGISNLYTDGVISYRAVS